MAENDPTRLKHRTVQPEKGKGKKERPRNNDWMNDSFDNITLYKYHYQGNYYLA